MLTFSLGLNQTAISPMVLINLALSNPQIHGDERDNIISKLNQLQAYWGSGKGYYNQQGGVVDFNRENPYCRFKVDYYFITTGGSGGLQGLYTPS